MKDSKRIFVTTLLVALLAGCGGGGGGGGGGDAVVLDPLALDQDNAMQVAAAVLDAVALVQDLGSGGVVPPVTAASVAANDVAATPPVLIAVIREQLGHFPLLLAPAADFRIAAVEIPPTSFECVPGFPENGTFTISGEVVD